MAEEIVKGSDIIYSLIPVKESDIELVNSNKLYHQFVGYICVDEKGSYKFYSIEDNYKNAIVNHWSIDVAKNYDNHNYWFIIKDHPCKLYNILSNIYKGNYVCHVDDFDIWKSNDKNCLVGVVTDIELD